MNPNSLPPNDSENVLPDLAREAFENYPRLQPSVDFNRAVLQSLELEKMRKRSTLVGRIEEFLGIGIWQFTVSSALGALIPAIILGSMLFSNRQPTQNSLPKPPPDPLGLNYYGPLYARELFECPAPALSPQTTQKPLVMPMRRGELCPVSKSPLV